MKKLILVSFLAIFLITSCEKEVPMNLQSENYDKIEVANNRLSTLIKKNDLLVKLGSISKQNTTANARVGVSSLSKLGTITDYNYFKSIVNRVIDPGSYQCGPTVLDTYFTSLFEGFTNNDFDLLAFSGIPLDYEYVFGNTDGGQYFGSERQFTSANVTTFKDLKRFWNIPTNIVLRAGHGTIFKDESKVISVLLLYGIPQVDAQEIASLLKIVFNTPKFRFYNHPIFTFNAFAAPADPDFGNPKKIVMGDGLLQAYAEMGFSDVATKQIMAHEYGHHVQFAKNVNFGNSPEATRRTELMADAFSAYYLTHSRGESMNWKRVREFLAGFYLIGDCAFSSTGHHGTPNQRMKAAEFGNKVANDASKQGKILTSEQFITLFDAALPAIVAPDAI